MKEKSYARFLFIWAGQLLSGLGTGITAFALGVHVFAETRSAAGFAMVILSLFLPSILLRPFGGVLADRFDRRIMIILGDLGSAAGVLFLLISLLSGDLSLWKIYLGVGISSAFAALQNPAWKASLTDLVDEEQFAKAGGLVQLASSARHLLAPVTAGILLAVGGLKTVLVLDLATFVLAVGAVLSIPKKLKPEGRAVKPQLSAELKEGWKTLTGDRELLGIVLIISLVTFFVGFLQTLFAPMMLIHTDARSLGIIQSMSASGMLVSSLLIGVYGIRGEVGKLMKLGLGLAGLFLAAMGLSTNLTFITAAFFLFFLSLPLINTSAELLIRRGIPNRKQGRVWGIIGLLSQAGYITAYLSAGFLADRLFDPLLLEQGALAASVGRLVGTGPGRGIGLMLILCGFGLGLTTFISSRQTHAQSKTAAYKGA